MLGWGRLQPHSLPNATTGRVPDHVGTRKSLLADGDLRPSGICRIEHMDDAAENELAIGHRIPAGSSHTARSFHWH